MKKISIEDIVAVTGAKLLASCENENAITGVKHDSRECGEGDLFVAIIGGVQDGHKYIPQVLAAGCRSVLVSHTNGWLDEIDEADRDNINIIMVDDTVYKMGELAKWYLDGLGIKKIAVTGSVGKTSTRDMIYFALSEKYNTGKNLKNFNNDIGLPISIFQFDENTEAAVLEIGMNHFNELSRLTRIIEPEIAVITNIGVAHMENLGSRDGIFKAKMEITEALASKAQGGTLVYARDEEFLNGERTAGDYNQVSVGTNGHSDYIISDIDDFGLEGIEFNLEHNEQVYRVKLPVAGLHNATNAAIAIAVAQLAGVSIEDAIRGLGKVNLTGSRLKKVSGKNVTVIDDTYNANPDSMKSALRVLEKTKAKGKRVAILGDMYELGDNEAKQHFGVGIFARNCQIDTLISIGELGKNISDGANGGELTVKHYDTKEEMIAEMKSLIHSGDVILVKASRGLHLEDIVKEVAAI